MPALLSHADSLIDNCQLPTTQILRHCGLWEGLLRTLASARGPPGRPSQVPEPRCDLELVLEERVPVRATSEPDRRGFF